MLITWPGAQKPNPNVLFCPRGLNRSGRFKRGWGGLNRWRRFKPVGGGLNRLGAGLNRGRFKPLRGGLNHETGLNREDRIPDATPLQTHTYIQL